jgi:hypothetical protein
MTDATPKRGSRWIRDANVKRVPVFKAEHVRFDPKEYNTIPKILTFVATQSLSADIINRLLDKETGNPTVGLVVSDTNSTTITVSYESNKTDIKINHPPPNAELASGDAVVFMQYALGRICQAIGDQLNNIEAEWDSVQNDIQVIATGVVATVGDFQPVDVSALNEFADKMKEIANSDKSPSSGIWNVTVTERVLVLSQGSNDVTVNFSTVPDVLAPAVAVTFAFILLDAFLSKNAASIPPVTAAMEKIIGNMKDRSGGGTSSLDATNGDATNGDAANGDATNGDAATHVVPAGDEVSPGTPLVASPLGTSVGNNRALISTADPVSLPSSSTWAPPAAPAAGLVQIHMRVIGAAAETAAPAGTPAETAAGTPAETGILRTTMTITN